MLKWFKRHSEGEEASAPVAPPVLREIDGGTNLDELLARDTVMVFKHSTACPVSWAAHHQVMRFLGEHRDFPLYMVPVIQQRAASNGIAEKTRVPHESPQVILLRGRQVMADISHGDITAAELNRLIAD